jgi:precorrin-6Y C5,15-methyltransferase (decarboxylating)
VIDVVGMAADGPGSCSAAGRAALAAAEVVLGGRRHLALLDGVTRAERVEWPSPLRAGLPALLERYADRRVAVVASGDPLVAGVGSTLIEVLGTEAVRLHPAVSSVAFARARLGWPAEAVAVVRLGPPDRIRRVLAPGATVLVLSADETSPAAVARICVEEGLGAAGIVVLGDLGTPAESRLELTAAELARHDQMLPRLNIVGVTVPPEAPRTFAGLLAPGLPDEAYEHDGQLTKRHLRAAALGALQPAPGELLWDLGAGAGSIGIEWARLHPANRVIAVERDPERADRITRNAGRLGVPDLQVRIGSALDLISELPAPDAVFVGGGATAELLDRCHARLGPRGRLVVHGVTLETEAVLLDRHARLGGELVQLSVTTAAPLGRYRGWLPARPVVQWSFAKETV